MESIGPRRKYIIMVFQFVVFNATSSHKPTNVSSVGELADIVLGRHTLPSWYHTSVDAVLKHGEVSLHPHNRWRTQMAFSKTVYSFQVKEDTAPGTVVGKVETQFESLTPVTYSVEEDDGDNLFLLSPVSGEFLLTRSLDFETQRFYVLTVEVQQGDLQVSGVRVYFNLLDVNDNPPVFSRDTFSAVVPEDTNIGTCFLSLNVSDKDEGDNGEVKMRVVGGDEEEVFATDSTGSLCLSKPLDRERQSSYNLTVTANDCGQPASLQFTSTAHLIVIIEDVNDNAPMFVSAKSVSIPEDTALRSVVMTVHAEDEDAGSNGMVLYYIKMSGGIFSIDNRTGKVYLEELLDREEVNTLTVTIIATDEGSPVMATSMNVTVHVEDVNDHDPEFSQSSYSLTVTEDVARGTSLLRVQARDRDMGPNGCVRYVLARAGPFVVDAVRGVVTVMDELDRERDSNYTLIITAVDRGNTPRSAAAVIHITVVDINDFAPQFFPETLIIHVKENEEDPAQLTHQVLALDEDLGINSQLTYFIEKGNGDGLFSVTPSGTFHILHSLDKEKESLYMVTITAVDSGLPSLTGTLTVRITVNDVNDNPPEFTEEAYNTIVPEDSPIGTVFAVIIASDVDEGVSGEIRYSMEILDVPFAIDEASGELFTTNVLDRETEAIYRLEVTASDKHPNRPLSSSVLVTVLIGDINDHWPKFMNSPYVAYVPTALAPGSVVCAVRASDGDTDMNAELHYSLHGESSDMFSINPHSGTVFTSRALQLVDDITVSVRVEDAGEDPKSDTTTISVRFQNISDFPKMNVDVLSSSLSEDDQLETLVAVVSAVSIRAEPVSFYLASGNFEDTFHIEHFSGALIVEKPLDFESKREFSLLIEARDSGSPPFSCFSEIHINITDVNDNFPQFTQVEYKCEVFENSPPGVVCDVLAIDADSGFYGAVRYRITDGDQDDFFTIDPENGSLSTTVSLDREHIPEFNLTVEAEELENPLHKDKATVIITVLDRNDNAPRFSQIFLAEVPEDAPAGRTIMQVTSTDDDADASAVINYSLVDQSDDMLFNIDFYTGYVTVEGVLDREVQDRYILKVSANDSAWSTGTEVTIVILDVNDNEPVFSEHLYSIILPETKDEEVSVLQILATDADIGRNGDIFYVIEPPHEDFWINATTGEIYSKQPLILHDSNVEIYQFTVTAFDSGSIPLHSNATIRVRLEQYNQHPPMFLPLPSVMAIPHHLTVGSEVVQFAAVDLDVNSSTSIMYALNGGNASYLFWIQADTGKLILKQNLAENENQSLTLLVMATDQGTPPLTSQTKVTFQITGRNYFSPSFSKSNVTLSVPEDLPVGSAIGKIQAEDGDRGPNGAITYSITPENPYLSIGEFSGLLTLIRELDFEEQSIHHFQIKAKDGAWFSKTGTLNVTVIVMDVNDNPPVFSSSEYMASVPENSAVGTNVLDVTATDTDSVANAQIFYSLVGGHVDKFAIDSGNGSIITLDIFDYEQEQMFELTVKASNTGGHTLFSLTHVVIQISDVNEFTPAFLEKEFNFSVFKNVPVGSVIGKVRATDGDRGSEGELFYFLFGQKKNAGFEIHERSGDVFTTSSLRKHGNSRVVFKVLVKNSGVITGMEIDETFVHISVIDTNEAPVFTSAWYVANVTEDSPAGTSVLTVSAVDQDAIPDWNHFFFSIEHGNANFSFSIDPSSGVISVNSPLDREVWPVYNLTVTATDNGSPPAAGTTHVTVTIGDINDNAPKLTSAEAQVKENQPEGTIVTRLTAYDSDLPPNQGPFTFWLLHSSVGGAFSLTPDGVLLTTRTIDREQISSYRVLVVVRDAGFPLALSSTSAFHIRVVDENDNPPLPRNIFIEVKYFGSSFQGGMIGDVHPEDRDESDTFNCTIKSAPVNMFTIPNGTCELWSSPFQGEATFNISIEATDQLHFPVNNSIYVNYKGFTNASIESCILFYVSSSSMEQFLSNNYLRFVKALDSLFNLQASKTHVFGIKHIGGEILLLASVKNYNGQYLSREVASRISAGHKKLLEAQSNVTISHIITDPCLTSPCQNGASCQKNIYINQDVAVLESVGVIFVSPKKEIFNCTCPVGFTGPLCEEDIDECVVSPCEDKGRCVNTAGSFYCRCEVGLSDSDCAAGVDGCLKMKCRNGGTCIPSADGYRCHCVPGFEGEICEEFIDHCRSAPCVLGTCTSLQTGFTCNCPFGVSGVRCEDHSYGFEELSFMEFPPLDRRTNLISLEFATVQRNALLLYNPGGSNSREFLALEILDGAIHLSYNLGSGPVKLQTYKQVADGYFHSVTAGRIGNTGSLHVDSCTEFESNGFCFSKNDGSISERTLDVGNSNMTFGGLRTTESILVHPTQIKTHDFVGCIRNIHVNGILLRPSMALAAYNIFDRCPRATVSPCYGVPCKNGGVCHDHWSDYFCECKSSFTGRNCDKEMPEELVLRFTGGDYIDYVVKEKFKRDYLMKETLKEKVGNTKDQTTISIRFKTKHDGVLMSIRGQRGYIILQIKDRKPEYIFKDILSGRRSDFTVDPPVADGVWHLLSLISSGHNTVFSVDDEPALNITGQSMDLTPVSVKKITLGAAPTRKTVQSGFSGCVQYFNVTGYFLPVSGHSVMVDVRPSSTLTQSSCSAPDVCLPSPCSEEDVPKRTCLSNCQNQRKCGLDAQNKFCICLHNVSDHFCDLCISTEDGLDRCPEMHGSMPLWLIAVALPLIFILVIAAICVVLYRVRRSDASCQSESLPVKTEQGAENLAFSFDDSPLRREAVSPEKGSGPDLMRANQPKSSVEIYCDNSLSSVQPLPKSELEYYEIGSICSAFHSDSASLKLSWQKHLYSSKCVKADPKQWGDLRMLFAGFKKESPGDEKSSSKHQNVTLMNEQLLNKLDFEQSQQRRPCYVKRFGQPEFLEPMQCLTFEEIGKLNAPMEKILHRYSVKSGAVEPTTMMDVSCESERDDTFTCSESENGQFPVISGRNYIRDQSLGQRETLPFKPFFKQPHLSADKERIFEEWKNILNMHLPFSSYAPVFKDIAGLPIESSHSYDVQSDIEEII